MEQDILKWILGLIGAGLLAGAGGWMNAIHGDLKKLAEKLDAIRDQVSGSRENAAVLEQKIIALDRHLETTEARLTSLARQVDKIRFRHDPVEETQ